MIFCNTIRSLHDLEYFLQEHKIPSLSLHSDLQKQARLQNYQLFRDGQATLMLSTDLGARGLDIPNLERVINYDFPLSTCDYLQRAGRTGRAVIILLFRERMGKQ
jgi:superfamily II DNA/RNA helicase